jgi:hypothetical protein
MWYFYIDGVLDGSYNIGVSNSGGSTPYAYAEVEGAYTTSIILGPAEFRNLMYRDTNNVWQKVSSATANIGYGAGSGTLPPSASFPYGVEVVGANDWIAGSGLSQATNNQLLWVGSTVMPEFPITGLPALTLCVTLVLILVREKGEDLTHDIDEAA